VAKQKRIEGSFESNLWQLVLENAGIDRFRALFEIKHQNDSLLCIDPSGGLKGTVFDFCRKQPDYEQAFKYLYNRLPIDQRSKIKPWE
jgi:hypothetical protein